MYLHGVALSIMIVSYLRVVEVRYARHLATSAQIGLGLLLLMTNGRSSNFVRYQVLAACEAAGRQLKAAGRYDGGC